MPFIKKAKNEYLIGFVIRKVKTSVLISPPPPARPGRGPGKTIFIKYCTGLLADSAVVTPVKVSVSHRLFTCKSGQTFVIS